MQDNVTWQTSSEYCSLMVPIGRTMYYTSVVQKIQIPEIFGSLLVQYMYSVSTVVGRFPTRWCMKLHCLYTTHFVVIFQLLVKYNHTLM
jgi:hypothetical protein